MSLRAFHLIFILCSTILSLGTGWWGVRSYKGTGDIGHLSLGVASLIGATLLIQYSRWSRRKLETIQAG